MLKKLMNTFKKNVAGFIFVVLCVWLVWMAIIHLQKKPVEAVSSRVILEQTWVGFQQNFIHQGRVVRPIEKDSVSEGQAYTMLRAVYMNDKKIFDECYAWSEHHLSRLMQFNDHLLAWHWKDGRVSDWMPASDADLDYAYSLILADEKWHHQYPDHVTPYGLKAKLILQDILKKETFRTSSNRLYLHPWIASEEQENLRQQNLSYYAPAYFRKFYQKTNDVRWLELLDTYYAMIDEINYRGIEEGMPGIYPDWMLVDQHDQLSYNPKKSNRFGWEAIRIPIRMAMDHHPDTHKRFKSPFTEYLSRTWQDQTKLYAEYQPDPFKFDGVYEHPLFYAGYALMLREYDSSSADEIIHKTRMSLKKIDKAGWVYLNEDDYYVNALMWLVEYVFAAQSL
ncbi:MAG: endoglucanase [Candidatus Omnitrophica bacterium]|nr:endoglucanase [Candidatus Omnitrophota bacterium]